MRPTPNSQAGRILALLETGGWWTTSDLLRAVPSITHSRIADLREKGFAIEHKTVGPGAKGSLYRLTGGVGQLAVTSSAAGITGEADEAGVALSTSKSAPAILVRPSETLQAPNPKVAFTAPPGSVLGASTGPGGAPRDTAVSPSPGHGGTSPQGVPSDQLALEIPGRYKRESEAA